MRVLTIETSTVHETVGVVIDDRVASTRSSQAGRERGVEFLDLVLDALQTAHLGTANVDLIGVSAGPGRFTGLRVGMATAKGLATGAGCGVAPVETLHALATASGRDGLVAPLIDARRGEVYAALFDGGRRLSDDIACAPAELPEALPTSGRAVALVGGGAVAYRDELERAFGSGMLIDIAAPATPDPLTIARMAEASPRVPLESIEPVYIRGVGATKPPARGPVERKR